ncbi:hypothetical protein FIBSPDRAFT_966141 [Athelia psychrophila]|uniref:Proteophosphoglycan ppg4 n=1 Tax=Athelia psychrophila TaxID=1759441 RepID=A0A167X3N0_9AGAM|nr:hypothetical protein FIBSPDRAFT_966141 [Fibularhizoctonia sp. CBS 109695]
MRPASHSDSPKGQSSSASSSRSPSPAPAGVPAHTPSDPPSSASPTSPASPYTPHTPARVSEASDGYPSWLPKRPPPPAPGSTFHSSTGGGPSEFAFGGRRPTPRSIRIVNVPGTGTRRQPTDQTRVPSGPIQPRAWSKATGAGLRDAAAQAAAARARKPRFRAAALHPELVQSPSAWTRIQFFLFPLFALAHIPLQTYFDFNAVYILFEVSKFPNPTAPGVPGSGKNWALGAAAYIACWAVWILVVCIVYDFVYSFLRRWRVKRPTVFPLYLSAPAHTFVSMTSYTHFCFMRQIRRAAFADGPRAGLALALLLSFSARSPAYAALADAGQGARDGTFFRGDGTLSPYATGVLAASAAWTAWRTLVLLGAYLGLWVLSGQACAGLCGPRYRWEEEDAEKRASAYSENASLADEAVPWAWREGTQARVLAVYQFCLTTHGRPYSAAAAGKEKGAGGQEEDDYAGLPNVATSPEFAFEGMEQVMAAVGFPAPASPHHARRGVLTGDLFDSPKDEGGFARELGLADVIPSVKRLSREKEKNMAGPSGPLMSLPYPFAGQKAQVSNDNHNDNGMGMGSVPFPSPDPEQGFDMTEGEGDGEDVAEGDGDDEEDDEEEEEEESEQPAGDTSLEAGRASGSMSSLGHPVSSRYPFQFRLPARNSGSASGRGSGHHSGPSQSTTHSNSRSTASKSTTDHSRSANSRSIHSHSTGTRGGYVADVGSPHSIPMPPRHPQAARGRPRSGTTPSPSPRPAPIVFPTAVRRARADSSSTDAFSPVPLPGDDDDEEEEEEEEEEEGYSDHEALESPTSARARQSLAGEEEDSVGLLSAGTSPRTSFVGAPHRTGTLSAARRSQTSVASSSARSRSRTGSAVSSASAARSRAQSLIQALGAQASRSSVELVQAVRSRTHSSMARLEEDMSYHSRSPRSERSRATSSTGSASASANGDHTFGFPMAPPRESAEDQDREGIEASEAESEGEGEASSEGAAQHALPPSPTVSITGPSETGHGQAPSENPSLRTVSPHRLLAVADQAGSAPSSYATVPSNYSTASRPDISTAAPSFVTNAPTLDGTSGSSEDTHAHARDGHHHHHHPHVHDPSSWGPV